MVAIASLVVVGRSSSVDGEIRLDLATSEVADALRFARSEAIRTGFSTMAPEPRVRSSVRVAKCGLAVRPGSYWIGEKVTYSYPGPENSVWSSGDRMLPCRGPR